MSGLQPGHFQNLAVYKSQTVSLNTSDDQFVCVIRQDVQQISHICLKNWFPLLLLFSGSFEIESASDTFSGVLILHLADHLCVASS